MQCRNLPSDACGLQYQDFLIRPVLTRLDRDAGPTIAIGPQLVTGKVLLILVAEFFEKGP